MTPSDYEYLRKLLKERSGLDLSADKQYLVESRLVPLARRASLPGIPELVVKMKGGASHVELDQEFDEIDLRRQLVDHDPHRAI